MNRPTIVFAVAALGLAACKSEPVPEAAKTAATAQPAAATASAAIDPARLALFGKLPEVIEAKHNPITEEKIALGRMLYYDTRLSKNHDLSCNSCHDLAAFGVDGKATSPGHKQQLGTRNSPTVYNAAGRFAQFWDGRAAHVEEQATMPITNPVEMAMPDPDRVVRTLRSIPAYVDAFRKAFPEAKDPVTMEHVGMAIGAFERRLVTPARWDRFLGGDQAALTAEEKAGFNKFVEVGCTACHMGAYVGGTMYQKLGLVKPWPSQKDQGRFEVTKNEADRMMFAVPTLRNIAKTAPYFHDGSVADLGTAVKMMAEYELGKQLTDAETKQIVAWLDTLTGEIPAAFIARPELPPSGPKTPKPDPT